jgi:superfamily II DNA/RNA helicase
MHDIPTPTFAALGLPSDLVDALATEGVTEPFPIQALAIPVALEGRDVCGKAKTGSGKTLAFGLPLLVRTRASLPKRPRALVLVPTRELAVQVAGVLTPLAKARSLRVLAIYGGVPLDAQVKHLRKGVDVVVGTPGRLIDLYERGDLSLADVESLVLDEADRMADMGFMPQVEWLLRRVESKHQTLLFSATLDGDVGSLVKHHLREPATCEVVSEQVTVEEMTHVFLGVHQMDKVRVVASISRGSFRTLVFTRTKRGADRLVRDLRTEGVNALGIHGDLRQRAREKALADFAVGKVPVLVATDVAARGLDVEGIDTVVHFDVPDDHKAYLHRSGRTARAGESGVVVTLVLWNNVLDIERLQRRIGVRQPIVEVFSNDPRLRDLSSFHGQPAAV